MLREYICLDPAEYRRLTIADKKTSEPLKEVEGKCTKPEDPEPTLDYVQQILNTLPSATQIPARQVLDNLIHTERFKFVPNTGEIIVDNKLCRGSNLFDILEYICGEVPREFTNHFGLSELLTLLSSTKMPSFVIQNERVCRMFIDFRRKT